MVIDDVDERGSAGPDMSRLFEHPGMALFRAGTIGASTDWGRYGKCSQVCGAAAGKPCVSRSGRVVGGRTDGVAVELDAPHVSRRVLAGK